MAHTQGKWAIDPIYATHVRLESGIGTGGPTICICDSKMMNTDNEANAKLIAVAPEMLEVLSVLISDEHIEQDLYLSWVNKAKEIIKRATE